MESLAVLGDRSFDLRYRRGHLHASAIDSRVPTNAVVHEPSNLVPAHRSDQSLAQRSVAPVQFGYGECQQRTDHQYQRDLGSRKAVSNDGQCCGGCGSRYWQQRQ